MTPGRFSEPFMKKPKQKRIKCVYEGNPIVLKGNPMDNGDLTQELNYVFAA